MRVWKCKEVVDFDKSTTTVKEERNKTLQQKTTDKYNRFHIVTFMYYGKTWMEYATCIKSIPCNVPSSVFHLQSLFFVPIHSVLNIHTMLIND